MPLTAFIPLFATMLSLAPARNQMSVRANIVDGYRQLLAAYDHDGDGRLSRVEWQAMVDIAFPPLPGTSESTRNDNEPRASSLGLHQFWDADKDGFLTLEELTRPAFASFDCMDGDHDGRLTQTETFSGMERCPSITWTGREWAVLSPISNPAGTALPAR